MSEVKIPEGYQQTEVGVIPKDWEVKNFGELFESSIPRKTIKPSNLVTFVGMQDVTENAQLAHQTIISYERVKSGFTYFEKGDVLLAKITPCFENGKGCHTKSLETKYGFGSTEFHVLRANSASDSKFIYFWTTHSRFRIDLESAMVGSAGHRRVPFSEVRSYQIPCPASKSEQTAIATALSDVDDLIGSLEKLIAKKEAIKTGTMQQLLTGKTRLPEFATREDGNPKGFRQTELGRIPEDWEVKAIAKIVKDSRIPSGLYKDKNSYATGAGTSIIKLGDVFSTNIFDPKSAQRVNVDKSEIERYKVEIGDLIIALASVKLEGVGKVMHVTTLEEETIYDHNVALIRTINNVSSSFLSYTFHSNYFRSLVASKATQVGTTFLKASTILGFELHLPSIKEQNAIATVLSDMDAEIQALQQRLEKTKDIKQGMMQ